MPFDFSTIADTVGGFTSGFGLIKDKNLFEACAAAGVLISNSGGKLSSQKLDILKGKLIKSPALANFTTEQKVQLVEQYKRSLLESPYVGRMELEKEIEDVGKKPDKGKMVVAMALDIAAGDDKKIDNEEMAVIYEIIAS